MSNQRKRFARCPQGDDHLVDITYDVPNDEYFVACYTCGCEGRRLKTKAEAGRYWRRGKLSREGDVLEDSQ